MTAKPSVALIGAGAMGGALFRGWLQSDAINARGSVVFDPAAPDSIVSLAKEKGVAVNPEIRGGFDFLVVAIKPQLAEKVLPDYGPTSQGAVVMSVMAGTSIATLSRIFPGHEKFIRTMPNLPAAIGAGVSGLFASDAVSKNECDAAEQLMAAAGASVWVERESDMDLVTAVSGSGPAYFFLLAEALAEAGEAAGLSAQAASTLAEATLAGAGKLMDVDGRSASDIRKAVTSPGGTTAAALGVLDGDEEAIRKLMKEAVAAAAKRAGELSG